MEVSKDELKKLVSEEFAKFIENLTHDDVTFVIGGPTGLSDEVLESPPIS